MRPGKRNKINKYWNVKGSKLSVVKRKAFIGENAAEDVGWADGSDSLVWRAVSDPWLLARLIEAGALGSRRSLWGRSPIRR